MPKQRAALESAAFETLYGGAAGGGKSDMLVALARLYHKKSLLLRRTFPDLERSLILRSQELYQAPERYNAGKHVWTFPDTQQRIEFGHLKDDAAVQMYQCFHPDTEIMTLTGWVNIAQAQTGQLAATLDPVSRQMTYAPISATWVYDFSGELVVAKQAGGVSFAVTPNHNLWFSSEKRGHLRQTQAQDLPADARIPQWAYWQGVLPPATVTFASSGNNGRTLTFAVDDWLEFLGWYLSEGSIDKNRPIIRLSQVNTYGRAKIEDCLQRLGVNYSTSPKEFRFCNKALWQYLKPLGRSGEKYIPQDIKQYPPAQLEKLLFAIVEGDGTWSRPEYAHGHFVSSSKRLADDVGEIAFKCGYRVSCGLYQGNPESSPYGTKPRWHVQISRRNKRHDTQIRGDVGRMSYTGKVYCVTVEPHHSVLIRYQGRISWSGQSAQYDFIGFDELTQFTKHQYIYMVSRLRSVIRGQRVRIVACTNPGNEGNDWVMERFAAWLDEGYPYPAQPGEIRWFKPNKDDRDVETTADDPDALSRTFIPALLEDNPYLADDYRRQLNALPEPLRSQLKSGKWNLGMFDDPYQIVPTAWIRDAQDRWLHSERPGFLTMLGVDVARGGNDQTVLAPRYGWWVGLLQKYHGRTTTTGFSVAQLMQPLLARGGAAALDVIGIGSAAIDAALELKMSATGINVSNATDKTDRTGKLRFLNVRAYLYWKLREALDPEGQDLMALPPDSELLGDLRATKYALGLRGVKIIEKDDIKTNLGRSPNCADAVMLSMYAPDVLRGGVGRIF